jgi:spore germination cell wall hydrolase CwlJ-like protein
MAATAPRIQRMNATSILRAISLRQIRNRPGIAGAAVFVVVFAGLTAVGVPRWIERDAAHDRPDQASELDCLARNVYYESRGEPMVGQYAVAEVTMNRVASAMFPDSVCLVVNARGAFSWTSGEGLEEPYGFEWWRAQAVARSVYGNHASPYVGDALFYHATYVSPRWARTRDQVALIGHHLFYR